MTIKWIVFFVILLLISLYDLKQQRIPNRLILAGLITGGIFALCDPSWMWLIGAGVGFAVMLIIYLIFPGATGEGDVKLAMVIGLFLGYPNVLEAIGLSYIIGAVIAIILLLTRQMSLKSSLPFGPFMAVGSIVVTLFGPILWFS